MSNVDFCYGYHSGSASIVCMIYTLSHRVELVAPGNLLKHYMRFVVICGYDIFYTASQYPSQLSAFLLEDVVCCV